jgi:serine/threonine protein kinase
LRPSAREAWAKSIAPKTPSSNVLPDSFADDPERVTRFQREAQMLASLNHPNIAQIYGVEDRAIVMELVEGATPSSPLPIETALNYARQIAEALEYAHERGVIHRDLKPANIKVTPEGTVKLLDFGLAKAIEGPTASADNPEHSPTLTLGVTRVGVIMGTAAYMSPEQANGKTADRRADIWGFGVVLYEMLSGKSAFAGESVSDTLASVLKLDPDWSALPAETPASIRRLIQRCVTKDRKQRLQAIGEARIAIDQRGAGDPTGSRPSSRLLPWSAAAILAAALAIAVWAPWRIARPVEQPPLRLDVDLGSEISLRPLGSNTTSSVIISPDGTRLVYVASTAGTAQKLFTRRLDQANATELAGTEGAIFPFFSPDGHWVGFSTPNKLNKISVEGGAVVPLGDGAFGASWGEDGNIIVDGVVGHGLMRIADSGGAASPVTELANGENVHAYPRILPGGKAVLFTAYRGGGANVDQASIEVASLVDHRRKTLIRGGTSAHYLASPDGTGYLVYSHKGTVFAIPFDLNRLETRGTAVQVEDGVAFETLGDAAHFDVSRTGMLVYRKSGGVAAERVTTVQWLDASGKMQPLLAKPGAYDDLSLSPDGKRLAASVIQGSSQQDIYAYDERREIMTQLTFGGGFYVSPIWSPDGHYVVFGSVGTVTDGIYWNRSDGAGQPQLLRKGRNDQPVSFSPGAKRLAYVERSDPAGNWQIWTVPVEDSGSQLKAGTPEQFLKTQFNDLEPMFSPDGQWLAYESDESGKYEVYVRAFLPDGQGGKWPISSGGGRLPVWSRKNRELLYQSGDQMMAVKYAVKGGMFMPERPRIWAAKLVGADDSRGAAWFDLAPDGKHLAVEVPVSTPQPHQPEHEVTLVFNFLDELRRRVPATEPRP